MTEPIIEIDANANAAYLRLSEHRVARTREVTEDVLVDLDDMGVAVGVEVLHLSAPIPFGRLTSEFHVHSGVVDKLRAIQPNVLQYVSLTQAAEGTAHGHMARQVTSQSTSV